MMTGTTRRLALAALVLASLFAAGARRSEAAPSPVEPLHCASDAACDDGVACTVDVCHLTTGQCEHPVASGACCSDADCTPLDPCHVATCDPVTAACVLAPIPGTTCCTADADCPPTPQACTRNECTGGACHEVPDGDCCTADADCPAPVWCADVWCDLPTRTCHATYDPGACGQPCTYHSDCWDSELCTTNLCIDGACEHIPKEECCEVNGEVDGPSCDDGSPCTTDVCADNMCTHTPNTPLGGTPLPGCCADEADCAADGTPCYGPVCVAGTCVAIPGCDPGGLPYAEPFTLTAGQDLTSLGFEHAELGAPPLVDHWSVAAAAAVGSGGALRFTGTAVSDQGIESCVVSPAILTGPAQHLVVRWASALTITSAAAPVTMRLDVLREAPKPASFLLWSATSSTSMPAAEHSALVETPAPLVWARVRVCVQSANTWGDWRLELDDLRVTGEPPPTVFGLPPAVVVDVGASTDVFVDGASADGSPVTFALVGAPPFVSLGPATWRPATATWRTTLTASPLDPTLAGTYKIHLVASDGSSSTVAPLAVVVRWAAGALIWAPPDTPPAAAEALRQDLTSLGITAQIQPGLAMYPDLTPFDAVLVTLGAWPHAHTLTEPEASALVAAIAAGGRVYVEGSDAFAWAPPTSLAALFGATPVSDTVPASSLDGVGPLAPHSWPLAPSPTLTASLDALSPGPGSSVLFTVGSPPLAAVVAAPAGHLVASTILYGALADGALPRTAVLAAILAALSGG